MKKKEIKKLTKDEILKNIDKFKKDLFNFRFQKINSQITNPSKIGEIKKTIARLKTSLKEKSNVYRNSVFTKKTFEVIELITVETIGSLNLTNMKLLFGENDYTRKHGKILTYQYRFDKCVLDLFFNENSNKLIFYDMRERDYNGSLSIKKCLLELNLRKIKQYKS